MGFCLHIHTQSCLPGFTHHFLVSYFSFGYVRVFVFLQFSFYIFVFFDLVFLHGANTHPLQCGRITVCMCYRGVGRVTYRLCAVALSLFLLLTLCVVCVVVVL